MEPTIPKKNFRPAKGLVAIFRFFSSLGLATGLLVALGLLTWFATLEQVDKGLVATLNKYFDHHIYTAILLPEVNGHIVPLPLLSGYWVGVLLVINLTLGGIIRIRKGWRVVGVLISHFGIIFLLVAGGVAHHFSERGYMVITEGGASDVAEDYTEYVVEVAEIKNSRPVSFQVIRGKHLTKLTGENVATFHLESLPFNLQIGGYLGNAGAISEKLQKPQHGEEVVQGYYLVEGPEEKEGEANQAACHARVIWKDNQKNADIRLLLAGASFAPYTLECEGKTYTIDMRKRRWAMPFSLRLDKFTAGFYPGTASPSKFISEVTRMENDHEVKATIRMNEPLRYHGFTFFQKSYGPPGAKPGDKMDSIFEVVKNPSDKWPEYSIYIVAAGLLIHFISKLVSFLNSSSRKKSNG